MEDGLSKSEKCFFDVAKNIAELSDHKQKIGCAVIDRHKVISSGHNSQTKCHRLQAELDKEFFKLNNCMGPVHAEVDALLPLIKRHYDLRNATLYIYRQDRAEELALARPCERCMKLIKSLGIKKIRYTTADGYAAEKLVY